METLYVEEDVRGCILDVNMRYRMEEGADGLNMLKLFSQSMRITRTTGLWSDSILLLNYRNAGNTPAHI